MSGSGRNKGKFATVIVNMSQSKMGYREEAKNKGGSRKCKVREAGGLEPLLPLPSR